MTATLDATATIDAPSQFNAFDFLSYDNSESEFKVDTAIASATVLPTRHKTPDAVLLELQTRRQNWESTVYRTSNQALYAMLADCLAFAGPLTTTNAARLRSKALSDCFKRRGVKVNDSMPLLTQVVRAVFGEVDRRRISSYVTVLRRAQQDQVAYADLPSWIDSQGGIQSIRLNRAAGYVSPKERAERVQQALADFPALASVSSPELSMLADAEHMGQDCVLLAQQQADGSFAILAVVRSAGAVNAARLGYDGACQAQIRAATKALTA